MAIHFGKNNVFVLETKNTHYVLGIDKNGNIEKVMPKVKPDTNAAEILESL